MAIKMKKTHRTQSTTICTIVNHPPESSGSANHSPENSGFPNHSPENSSSASYSPENSGFPNNPPENSGYSDHRLYECKTCQKKFDTFQALGGHQGIHRKLIHDEDVCLLSLQIAAFPNLHQCKACMKKFPTGQALGGHMRRHRVKKTPILINKELLWRQEAAEEVVAAAEEPQWLKGEEDQRHKLKSELVLAAKDWRLSI